MALEYDESRLQAMELPISGFGQEAEWPLMEGRGDHRHGATLPAFLPTMGGREPNGIPGVGSIFGKRCPSWPWNAGSNIARACSSLRRGCASRLLYVWQSPLNKVEYLPHVVSHRRCVAGRGQARMRA